MPAKKVTAPPPGDKRLKTLERVLSKAGLGSRTEARRWIEAGRVSVNGRVTKDPDFWVDLDGDRVTLDGKEISARTREYLLLFKPAGFLTTYHDKQGRPTVYDLLPPDASYLFPVGRLDLDTSGLLIMTNDSTLAETIMNPEHKVPKTYRVTAASALSSMQLEALRNGVELSDGMTRPAAVSVIEDNESGTIFEMTITEGRNRQVRRMLEAVGSSVEQLERIAIGPVRIDGLESGRLRKLSDEEVQALRAAR
jgi:pseudouridine synthase